MCSSARPRRGRVSERCDANFFQVLAFSLQNTVIITCSAVWPPRPWGELEELDVCPGHSARVSQVTRLLSSRKASIRQQWASFTAHLPSHPVSKHYTASACLHPLSQLTHVARCVLNSNMLLPFFFVPGFFPLFAPSFHVSYLTIILSQSSPRNMSYCTYIYIYTVHIHIRIHAYPYTYTYISIYIYIHILYVYIHHAVLCIINTTFQ